MGVLCFEEKEIVLKAKKKNQKKIECHPDDKIRKKEINDKNDLNSDTLSTENNDQKSNPDNQVFDLCSFYIKNLSENIIQKYGYYLQSFCLKSNDILPENFMKGHLISSYMRSKMVNWMVEIFYTFHSSEETFLAAVEIMDKFFYHYEIILIDDDIYLIGLVSLFIASKAYDLIPIQLEKIIQIGGGKFTKKEILIMERRIIKKIDFDVFSVNDLELIQLFLNDFYINNKETFQKLEAEKYFDMLTNCTIWAFELCKHYEEYSSIRPAFLAIACLTIGYDFMIGNCDSFCGKIKDFFWRWLSLLYKRIEEKKEVKDKIQGVYRKILNSYSVYIRSNFRNLMNYHALYFD
jgi:hypothetical protein